MAKSSSDRSSLAIRFSLQPLHNHVEMSRGLDKPASPESRTVGEIDPELLMQLLGAEHRHRIGGVVEKPLVCAECVAHFRTPQIVANNVRVLVSKPVEDHQWRTWFATLRRAFHSVLECPVDMRVGKSVSADQDRIRFVGVSDQNCIEGLKWLDQELIELEPAGDERGCGKCFSFGSSIRCEALMAIEKCAPRSGCQWIRGPGPAHLDPFAVQAGLALAHSMSALGPLSTTFAETGYVYRRS